MISSTRHSIKPSACCPGLGDKKLTILLLAGLGVTGVGLAGVMVLTCCFCWATESNKILHKNY